MTEVSPKFMYFVVKKFPFLSHKQGLYHLISEDISDWNLNFKNKSFCKPVGHQSGNNKGFFFEIEVIHDFFEKDFDFN